MKKLVIEKGHCNYVEYNDREPISKECIIAEKKALLCKYKEDVEQVELFGMERNDYYEKKDKCRQLVLELRQLEKSLTN